MQVLKSTTLEGWHLAEGILPCLLRKPDQNLHSRFALMLQFQSFMSSEKHILELPFLTTSPNSRQFRFKWRPDSAEESLLLGDN